MQNVGAIAAFVYVGCAVASLVLAFAKRRGAVRAQLVALLVYSVIFAVVIAAALHSSTPEGECAVVHHDGEWPALLVSLAWISVLVTLLFTEPAALDRRSPRVLLSLVTILLPVGLGIYVLSALPAC